VGKSEGGSEVGVEGGCKGEGGVPANILVGGLENGITIMLLCYFIYEGMVQLPSN